MSFLTMYSLIHHEDKMPPSRNTTPIFLTSMLATRSMKTSMSTQTIDSKSSIFYIIYRWKNCRSRTEEYLCCHISLKNLNKIKTIGNNSKFQLVPKILTCSLHFLVKFIEIAIIGLSFLDLKLKLISTFQS